MSQDRWVQVELSQSGIATLSLARLDKHNALNEALIAAMQLELDKLAKQDEVRLLLIKSEAKHFSTGADLNDMKKSVDYSLDENIADASKLGNLLLTLYRFPKPTICMVHGACYGGAIGLVACCDIAVCESEASFCFSEVKLGLVPAMISPYIVKAIGARAAKAHFLTAEIFDGPKAYEMGLCYDVVSKEGLAQRAQSIAEMILSNGPLALLEASRLVDYVHETQIDETLLDTTAQWIAKIRTSPEGQEGLGAFLEKRPAQWIKK